MKSRKLTIVPGVVAFVALLAVTFSSCLKSVENQPPEKKAYISLMHLAAKAPALEAYVNGQKASQAIVPGSFSSSYSSVTPGTFDITFRKANSDSLVAAVGSNTYDSLKYYTLLVYNDQPTSAKVLRIEDDFSMLGTATQTFYRFFHMSADIPAVDLYIDNTKLQSARTYADNVLGGYNLFSGYTSGTYMVQVKKAGTDSIIVQTTHSLFQNNAYTIFLNGLANQNGVNTLKLDILQASNY